MSDDDKSRKTEEPTPEKLRKAREKGQVPKSQEIISGAGLITGISALILSMGFMGSQLLYLFDAVLRRDVMTPGEALAALQHTVIYASAPIVVVSLLTGILANIMQFGVLVAPEAISLDFKRVDPIKGFGRIFNLKKLLETLKAAFKIVAMGSAAFWIASDHVRDFALIKTCGIDCGAYVVAVVVVKLLLTFLPMVLVLSILDYKIQHAHFTKEQRMTKEEVKRERKDQMGSPEMQGERRRLQKEAAVTPGLATKIKECTAIATDGRHVVGVLYDEHNNPVPLAYVRERGAAARGALRSALANNVPIIQQPETAQLYKNSELDQPFPESAFEIVAPIIMAARQQNEGGQEEAEAGA